MKPSRSNKAKVIAALLAVILPTVTLGQPATARVLSVTQESFAKVSRPQVCWQTLVTAHQKAVNEQQNTPWLVRNWQPILGAAMGGAIAYTFTANYGASSQDWVWPTVAGGAAAGAVAGPGFTGGAYGLGTLAYSIWPTSLPLTIGFSLLGGGLGKKLLDMIFPKNPALAKPKPGEYLAEQPFFIETTCNKPAKVTYDEAPYLVKYIFKGKTQTARVKYYPGHQMPITAQGRPIYEVTSKQ